MKATGSIRTEKISRAQFVKGVPLSVPVADVIALGKKQGMRIKPSDVHAARYYMRKSAAASSPVKTNGGSAKPAAVAREVLEALTAGAGNLSQKVAREAIDAFRSGEVEEEFVVVLLRVGTERAKFIVNRLDPMRV